MNINIKITPSHITSPTRSGLMEKITSNYIMVFGSNNKGISYAGYVPFGEMTNKTTYVRVYNILKHNVKYRQVRKDGKYVKSVKVKEGYWEAFVYDIPLSLLELTKKKNIKQFTRNFKIY